LPGECGQYPEPPSWVTAPQSPSVLGAPWYDGSAVVHGWPLHYLWRTPQGWIGEPAKASPYLTPPIANPEREYRYVSWKLTDSVRDFRLLPLLVDVALMSAGLALLAGLVEWRRRRRSRAVQFTLRELLAFATLVAVFLGWWNGERAIYAGVKARSSNPDGSQWEYMYPGLPLWMRTLAGDEKLEWLGVGRPVDSFTLPWGSFGRQRDIEFQHVVEQFPRQAVLQTSERISNADAAALAAIEKLERLECEGMGTADLTRLLTKLEHHPNLRRLAVSPGPDGSVDNGHLASIATLPRLQSLALCSGAKLTERGLDRLRDCKSLAELEIDDLRLTSGALDILADIERLRRLNLSGAMFVHADLSTLSRLGGLEELCLWCTNLDDAHALQLRSLPSLRRLNIAYNRIGTVGAERLTPAGVKRLLDPSDGVFAHNLEQIALDADLIDDELIDLFKNLPRLHLIAVVWVTAPDCTDYRPLILKLRKALPDRNIINLPIQPIAI